MTKRALQGVNLGGWLVIEKWITPSLFRGLDARDERGLAATAEGRKRIERHRQEFITEQDFVWLAEHGVELVRVPFGYWFFDDNEAAFVSGAERLDWAMQMAEKYHLKVLLDFHAHAGSQNGKVHSGEIGGVLWFRDAAQRARSIEVCRRVAKRYADSPALWGIEVMNEPRVRGVRDYLFLRKYYRAAYRQLRQLLPASAYVVFSDVFMPHLLNGVLGRSPGAMMDVHFYAFGRPLHTHKAMERYFRQVKRRVRAIRRWQRTQPVIVGEWSAVLPHEALRHFSDTERKNYRARYRELQQAVYSEATAQCYWNYKTESAGSWNYRMSK